MFWNVELSEIFADFWHTTMWICYKNAYGDMVLVHYGICARGLLIVKLLLRAGFIVLNLDCCGWSSSHWQHNYIFKNLLKLTINNFLKLHIIVPSWRVFHKMWATFNWHQRTYTIMTHVNCNGRIHDHNKHVTTNQFNWKHKSILQSDHPKHP